MQNDSEIETETDETRGVGGRIRLAREAAPMTMAQLAQRLGVDLASLKAWEAGEREPRTNRLRLLGGILGVSLTWLLEGRNPGQLGPTPLTVHGVRQRLQRARALLAETAGVVEDLDAALSELDPEGEVAVPNGEA